MRKFFARIVDSLFPPQGDALCVRGISSSEVATLFAPNEVGGVQTLSRFRDARVRALIHEAKFHRSERAFTLLSTLLVRYVGERHLPVDVIVPIPLSPRRLRERGYNQVERILSAGTLNVPIEPAVLERTKHTKPQTELERGERLKNVRGAFAVTHPERVTGKHVLLVDDVTTTGATLSAARDTLLTASPASVTCIALAH
jgi:ComF family protein